MTLLNIIHTAIFGLPVLLLLFPIGAALGSYYWTRYNTETGKNTLKPNWFWVVFLGLGALVLVFLINMLTT